MTRKDFCEAAGVSTRHWDSVVRGDRNLGYTRAKRIAELLGTTIYLWTDPEALPQERRTAWEEFKRRSCGSVTSGR